MKKRYGMLFVVVLCVVLLISAGTYAYWVWTSNVNKTVIFNISSDFEDYVVYDSGDSYFVGDFQPSSNYCDGLRNTVSFKKTKDDLNLVATVNMQVNAIENEIRNSNSVYWVITSGDSDSCTGNLNDALNYGTFNGKNNGDIIKLLENIEVTTTEQRFTTWIWLDSSGSNLSSLSGKTLDTNIWTQIDMYDNELPEDDETDGYKETLLNGADPILDDGMVPIMLSNTGVATVANLNQEWYNYGDKEWANAVLVKESGTKTREYYLSNPGTEVSESDILAYYVWVPRYKYKIWTTNASTTTEPQEIDIIFEGKDVAKSSGTSVGSYLTHPAFTFGNKELNGIWVGKFETSHSTLASSTTTNNLGCTNENCVNADGLIIKPNVKSLRYNNVSNQFYASRSMERSGNPFGLNSSNVDSHMMKNSEWGAVAYLSHSQYGINQEIYINNSSGYYTGRSGGNVAGSHNTLSAQFGGTSTLKYNVHGYYTWIGQRIANDASGTIGIISDSSLGTKSSTSGNITGVYDMSGGAYEYVMGNYNNTLGNSGFTILPQSKYYDLYTITSNSLCTLKTCGGHALYETAVWYNDSATYINLDNPWFGRGGYYSFGINAGSFIINISSGKEVGSYSFRSVLTSELSTDSGGGGSTPGVNEYTITYNLNGGNGEISSGTKIHDVALTLSSVVPTRDGYNFLGWSEDSSATSATYQSGGEYTVNESATLYAVWQKKTYTISYNACSGTGVPGAQIKTYGEELVLNSQIPTRDGYTFLGWATIGAGGCSATNASYQSGSIFEVNAETTLYAVWLNAKYTDSILNGADPVLDSGMVPIVLSNTGVATVADLNGQWYNYTNKEWANAVLVKESGTKNRAYYLNNPGTEISESDILAYYVWIPRFRYQIWISDASIMSNPQFINVFFENKNIAKSNGTSVGEYLTHPAFTFGDEELNGIWVGKFETTGNTTTPTVKPNLQALRNQNISTQFITSLKFAGGSMNSSTGEVTFSGNNTYGLTSNVNSHMMKNNEWGAIAYLSYSNYGIKDAIYINNSVDSYTGRSAGDVGSGSTLKPTYGTYSWIGQTVNSDGSYGSITDSSLGTKASTTGNLTGIYDMSGGGWEYVMGNYNNSISSGGFTKLPESKYYDLYSFINVTSCTLATCGGHALFETFKWFNDYGDNYFVSLPYVWFLRGGNYASSVGAGIFAYYSLEGGALLSSSSRSVLIFNSSTSSGGSGGSSSGGEKYTVSYNLNGGSGTVSSQTKDHGQVLILSSITPTRDGYTFLGWARSSTATTAEYLPGANFTVDEETTLYAVWELNKIQNTLSVTANTLTYSGSSQTLVTSTNAQGTVYYSTTTALTSSNYSSSGSTTLPTATNAGTYTVYYYTPGNTSYAPKSGSVNVVIAKYTATLTSPSSISGSLGQRLTLTATVKSISSCNGDTSIINSSPSSITNTSSSNTTNITNGVSAFTFYPSSGAIITFTWTFTPYDTENCSIVNSKSTYTTTYAISYDANGGSGAPSSQTKAYGTDLTLSSTVPTRDGYTFLGWSTVSDATVATFQPGDIYSYNPTVATITLYAVWSVSGYKDSVLNGADPVLDSGMVPIVLSSTGVATVANLSNEWYNYGNKQWANAVLVKQSGSKTRDYYLSNPGVTVSESDILAYYVWIPRYRYQIWIADASIVPSPKTINIIYEKSNLIKSSGTSVGEYLTHPAFTFGDKELNGIWVGKFELSGDSTTPTIKPNLVSNKSSVGGLFTTLLKFSGGSMNTSTGAVTFSGSSTYGLSSSVDSHMMKNSEWGAVAYLSYSNYGINEEIYINNSSSYYTGRSAGAVGSSSISSSSYGTYSWIGQIMNSDGSYGSISNSMLGTKASTTGNITGIYDMSGGSYEYVMGNYNNTIGKSILNKLPISKYYDVYSFSNIGYCTLETCGGHALYETHAWYGDDFNFFVDSSYSWFVRGGSHNSVDAAGIFGFYSLDGAGYIPSSHSVLAF